MFCKNCGFQISDDSKFCLKCGANQDSSKSDKDLEINIEAKTELVPAKCTACGASLKVDASISTAICPYCNNAYIVEKAINNFNIKMDGNINVNKATINVSGINIDNLLVRAKDFELKYEYEKALNYYNKVLDIDFSRQEALNAVERVKNAMYNHIYFQSYANKELSKGTLQLKKNRIVYLQTNSKETLYYLEKIKNLKKNLLSIQFEYEGKILPVTIYVAFSLTDKWIGIINSAKKGIY